MTPVEALRQRPKTAGGAIALAIAGALYGVYVNEGGYSNHAADRGGETNFGITIKTARAAGYTGSMKDFPKHCTPEKPVCADSIYTDQYIKGPGFLPMAAIEPAVLDELVDSAVLHGPARPSRWFHLAINAECRTRFTVPRKVDTETILAYQACAENVGKARLCVRILDRMDGAQEAFFRSIVANNPSQRVFLKGWLRMRIDNVDRAKCG